MKLRPGLISLFVRHKVAANLLMMIMLLAGVWGLLRLNIQFLPAYKVEVITINIAWNGASAEDVENSIINPLEQELRNIDNLKTMTSQARLGNASLFLEFEQNTNMGRALEDVREKISRVRNLPRDSEPAIISRVEPYEPVAKLIVTGSSDRQELRPLVHRFERELLDRGIAKIEILGLPEQEVAIQIPIKKLIELNLSLPQIARRIALRSQDFPAGVIGKAEVGRQLRSLQQQRKIKGFEQLPIISDRQGRVIRLQDIADIELRAQDQEVEVSYQGKPAVEMRLLRAENANALHAAKIIHNWLEQVKPTLGRSIQLYLYDQNWQYIKERIDLLLKNGLTGLLLIILFLFLFLNHHVAWWVVVGIPTSFMAALAALYLYGGSINMVSLFALIMSLGIIVDDTIVVGEQALTNIHQKQPILDALENAAHKMLAPIASSSLTTICAFFPLFFVGGIIGTILFSIPLVVSCVILASLLECFLVLPGHLLHSFRRHKSDLDLREERLGEAKTSNGSRLRVAINRGFNHFRENLFRRLISWAIHYRMITVAIAIGLLVISLALVQGGYVNFTFFPTPESRIINANVQFAVGTPKNQVRQFLQQMNSSLYATNKALSSKGQSIVQTAVVMENYIGVNLYQVQRGEHYASMTVELTSPDQREINNTAFVAAWRKRIKLPAGIEHFAIFSPRGGPPGEDLDLQFSGNNVHALKQAAVELATILHAMSGVSDIKDDMPFGQEQLVYDLTITGKALGLTIDGVGRQLRAAFNGQIAQIYHEPNEEIEVRVVLPDQERDSLATLEQFPILTSAGKTVPLGTVVKLHYRQGPEVLLHTDTKLSVRVTAKVDNKINNANKILVQLQQTILPKLIKRYSLEINYRGKAEEQAETFTDMKYGLVLGLILIYIILAWVFSSYGWPFVVMSAIPLGLTGAIFGHLFMGLDLTILSLFGLFGLAGIVINDSIILLSEYKSLKQQGWHREEAIIEASCRRLRAVLLTSLTTIAGLTPLLFETSLQAQFLIPMATSISFGLAYATLLILLLVPVLLSFYEDLF